MSLDEQDSHEVVAGTPVIQSSGNESATPPTENEVSATSAQSDGAGDSTEKQTVGKKPSRVEKWTLETHRLSAEGVTVEVQHSAAARGWWSPLRDNIKDLGPFITGVATVIIAGLVFKYGNEFNTRQIDAQNRQITAQEAQAKTAEAQAKTAKEDLQLKILSEFSKSLTDLSAQDEKTRTLAAIRFVQYKADALSAIQPALGVGEEAIRKGAVTVVAELFQSEALSREDLVKSLLEYFDTHNAYKRMGILESFLELDRRLSSDEASKVTNLLTSKLNPEADCRRPEDGKVLEKAAIFLGLWPSLGSANLLLRIAKNHTWQRSQIQAVDNLPKVAQTLKPEQRKLIVNDLQVLLLDSDGVVKQQVGFAIRDIQRMGTQ